MAISITADDVRDEYRTTEDDSTIETAIANADDVVTQRLEGRLDELGSGPANGHTQQERLTVLVACHFLAAPDPTSASTSVGDEQHDYEGISTTNAYDLLETRFGRRAVTLDPTNQLLPSQPGGDGGDTSGDPDHFETFGV